MTTLYQLELDQRQINCGMSYVIQLRDGRFFMIDGGYFTPGEEDRLFDFLQEKGDGVPHIAGWFFSHAHQDHIGNFINFVRKYAGRYRLDALLLNFQPVDFFGLDDEMDWRSCDEVTVRMFYRTIDACCRDVSRRILHTGESLAFGEMTLDVLYTHEELYPVQSSFNDHSTVIRLTVGGQRVLFLGDIYTEASRILMQKPEQLQCDIVQVAHHGFRGATEALYRATGAKVALWPTAENEYTSLVESRRHAADEYLLYASQVQEHYISGYGTVALPLPYVLGTAKQEKPCIG